MKTAFVREKNENVILTLKVPSDLHFYENDNKNMSKLAFLNWNSEWHIFHTLFRAEINYPIYGNDKEKATQHCIYQAGVRKLSFESSFYEMTPHSILATRPACGQNSFQTFFLPFRRCNFPAGFWGLILGAVRSLLDVAHTSFAENYGKYFFFRPR